jgi:hypothetical protein
MIPQLNFNTKKIIQEIQSTKEKYKILPKDNLLQVNKIYLNKKGRPFYANLPKEIRISPEAVGLIVGEGYLGGRSFVFANSNENAIDLVLNFLRQFKTPLRIYLEISTKNVSKNFIKKSQSFWESHLNIKLDRIREREEFKNITKNGTIHVCLNGKILCQVIEKIILLSKKKIEKSRILSIDYLKGIIAAEGNINVKKTTNCLYMVRISASKPEEREHYKRCLNKIGINVSCNDMPTISPEEGINRGWKTTRGRAGAVIISRWENFVKIFEFNLLEINKDKEEKFMQSFNNNKFTKQFLDFKYFINKEFTMKEAQTYFGFKGRHVNRVLTLYKEGYISRKKISKNKFKYKLTDRYLALYNKLKSTSDNPTFQ